MSNIKEIRPALYVGTYAKYAAGSLKGGWMNLNNYNSREAFLAAAREMHSDEADPELMYQDFKGFPRAYYSESSAPGDEFWGEWLPLDEREREAFGLFLAYRGGSATVEDFRDAYEGFWESEADFCENLAEETGAVSPDNASWLVIDWEATWNCNLRYRYLSERGESGDLHIFRRDG